MPGMNGLDALKQVKQEFPDLPVLILSMHPEEQYAIRMIKAGADGYLTKSSAPEELVNAIKKVHGGGKYVSPSLGRRSPSPSSPAPRRTLTSYFQIGNTKCCASSAREKPSVRSPTRRT